jgi:hypothetical protein
VKRYHLIVPVIAAACSLAACAGGPVESSQPTQTVVEGPRFELELTPGPYYSEDRAIFFYRYTVQPQVACWVERPDGKFIDTIYATEAVATGDFTAAPKTGRPEALPVWSALRDRGVDAVSAPTAVGTDVRYGNNIASRLPAGRYVIMLETNRSYDWNETYTKRNSGVNGQPSIVYRAELTVGRGAAEARFVPIGTGSVDGSSSKIAPDLIGIDTAFELFSSMTVAYRD